mmetsp:Transcript_33392/g.73242  ORF Transcript_33392/g.73242 Transcript_33392/m.73242 type:complete len:428 (+) Transcript_33392:283-1566(+)
MNPMDSSSATTTSLLDLPPEVIARVSKFVDVFDNELHSFVSVCRPALARIIKKSYLRDSCHYLQFVGSADGHSARWRYPDFDPELARDKLLQWMAVNDGWREAHLPSSGGAAIPSVQADIVLQPVDSDGKEAMLDAELINGANHASFESFPPDLFRNVDGSFLEENYPFDVVIGVDGVDVSKMDFEQTKELILQRTSKPKTLRVLHSVYWCFFLNPAIALDLGLVDVFRNIVERTNIDINTSRCRGIQFDGGMPLLVRALVHPDARLFEYLLTIDGLNLNPTIDSSIHIPIFSGMYITLNSSKPMLHALTKDIITDALYDADLDVMRIKQLLDKGSDVLLTNAEDRHGNTPLWHIVHTDSDESFSRNDLLLAKCFLDSGASTDGIDLTELPNRRGYRGKMASLIEAKDRAARDKVIASLRPLKRKRD